MKHDDGDDDGHYDRAYMEDDNKNNTSSDAENRNTEGSEVYIPIQNPYYCSDDDPGTSNNNDHTNFDTVKVTENPYYE